MKMGLRDGAETNFWLDRWVDGGDRLIDLTSGSTDAIDVDLPVAAFISENGEWNWTLFNQFLHVMGVCRWKGPQWISQFLWLVAHNRMLTNSERHRRHLAEFGACQPAYQNGGAYLVGAGSSLVGHPQLRRLRSFRVWTSSSRRLDPDSQGCCLAAFSMNLGKCSITRAELRGVVSVLQLAWERGY
ncbi:hypothetical protein LINPERPRIM_LOCUS27817, partial [Linum perenne]